MKLRIILGSILLISIFLISTLPFDIPSKERASNVLPLIAPTFAQDVETSFLEEEAGIAAYTNTEQKIDLTKVKAKNIFEPIEKDADTYIIGRIGDMEAFIHVEGWIVVYYLKDEPIGKIADWDNYEGEKITSTKLERGLSLVCDAAEVGLTYVKYYDFRYPNANKLRMITESIEDVSGGVYSNTFSVMIPNSITVYDRSWLHHQFWDQEISSYMSGFYVIDSEIKVDDITINSLSYHSTTTYGEIMPTQLSPDVFHTVGIYVSNYNNAGYSWPGGNKGFIAIFLTYQESPLGDPSSRIITRDADSIFTLDLVPFSPSTQLPPQTPSPTPTVTSTVAPTPTSVPPAPTVAPTPTPVPSLNNLPYIIGTVIIIIILSIIGVYEKAKLWQIIFAILGTIMGAIILKAVGL